MANRIDPPERWLNTEEVDDVCVICLETGKQKFIKSKCTHKVCINCFREHYKTQNTACPVCNRQDWF